MSTSVCGLKYVPGRIVSSSSSKRRWFAMRAFIPDVVDGRMASASVAPSGRRGSQLAQLPSHLGLDVERRLPAPPPSRIAGDDQVAHLLLELGVDVRRTVAVRRQRAEGQPPSSDSTSS